MGCSAALWLTMEQHSDRENISKRFTSGASSQAPEGLPLQRELDFQTDSFSTDLTLDPIWDQFWSPKGDLVPYDARPGGTRGSIWALVGAQVLTLSATSGESCAKSGYSWPQT